MALSDAIALWCEEEFLFDLEGIGAVFHTSCVNYTLKELNWLSETKIRWILPDSVRIELELLRDSPSYGRRAAFILDQAARFGRPGTLYDGSVWDLEQLYENHSRRISTNDIFGGCLLFIFGDLLKMYEFLACAMKLPGHYVLHNIAWNCMNDGVVKALSLHQQTLRREADAFWNGANVRPISAGLPQPPLDQMLRLRIPTASGKVYDRIHGSSFVYLGCGNNANVYSHRDFPGKAIKIFHESAATENVAQKLSNLSVLNFKRLGHLPLALPEDPVYTEEGKQIGFTMRMIDGRPITDFYLCNSWQGLVPQKIIKNLLALLVELHCNHIIVNDLSFHNVLVDRDSRVYLIDCDSFQFLNTPGGACTEIYQHPEVMNQHYCDRLRQPRHEYFALAVLLFQCCIFGNPLAERNVDNDQQRSWKQSAFPLDFQRLHYEKANGAILRSWNRQDDLFRRAFSDAFHFRGDLSMGAWARALEVM